MNFLKYSRLEEEFKCRNIDFTPISNLEGDIGSAKLYSSSNNLLPFLLFFDFMLIYDLKSRISNDWILWGIAILSIIICLIISKDNTVRKLKREQKQLVKKLLKTNKTPCE